MDPKNLSAIDPVKTIGSDNGGSYNYYDYNSGAGNESSGECIEHLPVLGYPDLTQLQAVHATFVILYLLVMVLALCGNLSVIWIVWKHKSMHTATNYYIVSLAASDFLVSIFALPTKLIELGMDAEISPFKDSVALCSVTSYLQPIFVFASIWTLVAVSVDRYLAIIHPLQARSFGTKSRARKIIITIWMVGCLLLAPYLYPSCLFFYYLESDYGSVYRVICTPQFEDFGVVFVKGWHIFLMLILYFFPLTLLCICYGIMATRLLRMTKSDRMVHNKDFQHTRQSKSRRKLAKMVIVVVIAFCTCWAPHYVSSMVTIFKPMVWRERNFIFASMLNHLLGFANSSINPVIYAIMSEKFREGFKHIGIQVFTCRQRSSSTYGHRLARNPTLMSSGRSSADRDDNLQDPPGGAATEPAGGTTSGDNVFAPGKHTDRGSSEGDPNKTSRSKRNNQQKEKKYREKRKSKGNSFTLSFRKDHYSLTRSSSTPPPASSERQRSKGEPARHSIPKSQLHDQQQRLFVPIVHFGNPTQYNFCPTVFVEETKQSSPSPDSGRWKNQSESLSEKGENGQAGQPLLTESTPRTLAADVPEDLQATTGTQNEFTDIDADNPEDANYVCLSLVTDRQDICFEEEVLNKFRKVKSPESVCGEYGEESEHCLSQAADLHDYNISPKSNSGHILRGEDSSPNVVPDHQISGANENKTNIPQLMGRCQSTINHKQPDSTSEHIFHIPRDTTDDYYHNNTLLNIDKRHSVTGLDSETNSEDDCPSPWVLQSLENHGSNSHPPTVYITNV